MSIVEAEDGGSTGGAIERLEDIGVSRRPASHAWRQSTAQEIGWTADTGTGLLEGIRWRAMSPVGIVGIDNKKSAPVARSHTKTKAPKG